MNKHVWFVAGIAAGATVGLFYAPRSGVRMRAAAAAKTKEAQRFLGQRAQQFRAAAASTVERGSEAARHAGERINRVLEAKRKNVFG